MCGIFGYIGERKDAAKIVFEGIKSLEYRGYDSWGLTVKVESQSGKSKSELFVEKHVGKIGNAHSSLITHHSSLALGHTRWATHGGVTVANAHPHVDCTGQIAVVHNGIVENFAEIKSSLAKKHKFRSETDTEVLVHLVEELAEKLLFVEAVRKAFLKVKGLNAFIFVGPNGELVAIKNGSPLVIGVRNGETFIASDASALIPHTRKVIYLGDGELVTINGDKVLLKDVTDGKEKKIIFSEISWKVEAANLGKFKHYMLKEIYDQPKVLRSLLENGKEIENLAKEIAKSRGTFFIGCGTASYAALIGTYLFSSIAHTHVNFSIGSEFNYLEDYLHSKSLVVAISQSGETIDVVVPAIRAKERGARVVALTNVEGSSLWRLADFKIALNCGPEKAVCATKSFCAMVASLIYLAYSMGGKSVRARKTISAALLGIEKILKPNYVASVKSLAKQLQQEEDIYIVGRGLSYTTALEAALKLKEVAYIHSEGFAGGELKHGVIALIERGTPCIVFAPLDETYDDIISNAIEIKSRGAYIIGVSPKENAVFDYYLPVAEVGKASSVVNIVPIQLLSYYISLEKGLDPDMPRNLAKSVTVK